jgi:hypothetical protein
MDIDEEARELAQLASKLRPVMVSPEFQHLMDQALTTDRLPSPLRSGRAAKAFQQAFDLIGGVPRLALWADQNPDKFFPIYSKLIPTSIEAKTQAKVDINLSWVDPQRLAYKQNTLELDNVPHIPQPSQFPQLEQRQPIEQSQIHPATPVHSLPQSDPEVGHAEYASACGEDSSAGQ